MLEENLDTIDLSPDAVIEYAQRTRIELIQDKDISPKNKILALTGLTNTAVALKRIEADNNNATADRDTAVALANILKNVSDNPFVNVNSTNANIKIINPILPEIELVPDETSTDVHIIDYDDIMQKS